MKNYIFLILLLTFILGENLELSEVKVDHNYVESAQFQYLIPKREFVSENVTFSKLSHLPESKYPMPSLITAKSALVSLPSPTQFLPVYSVSGASGAVIWANNSLLPQNKS